MIKHSVIYVGRNTSIFEVGSLTNSNDELVEDATVEVEVVRERDTGLAVEGLTVPFALNHITDGNYRAEIDGSLFVAGRWYEAVVHAEDSEGAEAEFLEALRAAVRRG